MWPFLPQHLFVERIANALGDAAFDLARGEHGMRTRPDLLHGPELFDLSGISNGVDRDLRYVNGPCKGGIGFAMILLVVPEDAGRRLIAAEGDDFAVC